MQFYLLIMIAIRFLTRLHPGWILFVFILISWIWRALVFFYCQQFNLDVFKQLFLSTQIIGCLDAFGFGICLCRMVLDRKGRFFKPASIYRNPWLWIVVAVIIIWPAITLYWRWATYWEFWWMVIFWRTWIAIGFFTILATTIWLVSLVELNRFVFIPFWYMGEISYGIYLWHILVIRSLGETKIFTAPEFLFWALFFTISLSAFSWHFVEKPLIRKFR